MRYLLLSVAATLAVGSAQGSETIRCGRWVVDDTATVEELLNKCGEPTSRRLEEQDIRAPNVGGGTRKVGTTVTEYWTYDRGSQSLPVLVTIVDGKVRSIERVQ